MVERILNDICINDYYRMIIDFENEHKAPAYHGRNHAVNVCNLVEKILKLTPTDKNLIEDAMVAALLHDLGCYLGKDNHEVRSHDIAKSYLESNNIPIHNKELLLEAIKKHRNNFSTKNAIIRALILADKLDITCDRVTNCGKNIPGMRQLQYIKKIELDLEKNIFKVRFIADKEMNINELLNFYFFKKVISSIESYSEFIGKKYNIYINDEIIGEIYE